MSTFIKNDFKIVHLRIAARQYLAAIKKARDLADKQKKAEAECKAANDIVKQMDEVLYERIPENSLIVFGNKAIGVAGSLSGYKVITIKDIKK